MMCARRMALLALASLAACKSDAVPAVDATAGRDAQGADRSLADASRDIGARDRGRADSVQADSGPAPTAESEPNDGATATELNPIVVPALVKGAIGKADDADIFSFTAKAGDRLAVTVTSAAGAMQPHLAVFGDAALKVPPAVNAGPGPAAYVEYYVLKAGTYLIAVRDRRNVGTSQHVGGPTLTYELRLQTLTRAVTPLSLGGQLAAKLDPAGRLEVYSFSATQGQGLEISVVIGAGSSVDARLSLYHPQQQAWLGTNEHPTQKSALLSSASMPFGGTYHAIVENVELAPAPQSADFTIKLTAK